MFTKKIDKEISIFDTAGTTDSLTILAKDQKGTTKGIRDVSDQREYAANFTDDIVQEKYSVKQSQKKPNSKREQEIIVANRFLPVFNGQNKSQFVVTLNQPPTDSHIDVLIFDKNIRKNLYLQVRVSDDEPWRELKKKKFFERSGIGFVLHHNAIKRAIESKLKYPIQLRREILLLLDGWLGVRPEDLEQFKDSEKKFMENTGYKEIWFIGGLSETIVKLYP